MIMTERYRQETTDWGTLKILNHIYITEGEQLIGYIPLGGKEIRYKKSKKQWSSAKRKFRDLTKNEIAYIKENGSFIEGGKV
tara:strand:- start:172 stop:417 length:246 start_codon:yes stop_codon:yes gene_type:complete